MVIIFFSFLVLVLLITGMVNNYAADAQRTALSASAENAAAYLGGRIPPNSTDREAFPRLVRTMSGDVDKMLRVLCATGDDVTMLVTDRDGNVLYTVSGGIS